MAKVIDQYLFGFMGRLAANSVEPEHITDNIKAALVRLYQAECYNPLLASALPFMVTSAIQSGLNSYF